MAMHSLQDAFFEELQDALSAEKQIRDGLKKMIKKASNAELKSGFEQHLEETVQQIQRVEQAFQACDRKPRSQKCEAAAGLIEEGKEIMEHEAEPQVMDAMLIAAAQKVEHYEIATYGTLCTWAEMLGFSEAANLLKENLSEEKATDEKLTMLASEINKEAVPS